MYGYTGINEDSYTIHLESVEEMRIALNLIKTSATNAIKGDDFNKGAVLVGMATEIDRQIRRPTELVASNEEIDKFNKDFGKEFDEFMEG